MTRDRKVLARKYGRSFDIGMDPGNSIVGRLTVGCGRLSSWDRRGRYIGCGSLKHLNRHRGRDVSAMPTFLPALPSTWLCTALPSTWLCNALPSTWPCNALSSTWPCNLQCAAFVDPSMSHRSYRSGIFTRSWRQRAQFFEWREVPST